MALIVLPPRSDNAGSTTELAPPGAQLFDFSSLEWARCGSYANDLCKY